MRKTKTSSRLSAYRDNSVKHSSHRAEAGQTNKKKAVVKLKKNKKKTPALKIAKKAKTAYHLKPAKSAKAVFQVADKQEKPLIEIPQQQTSSNTPASQAEPRPSFVRFAPAKPSPHLIDLRQIKNEHQQKQETFEDKAALVSQEINSLYQNKKRSALKSLTVSWQNFNKSLAKPPVIAMEKKVAKPLEKQKTVTVLACKPKFQAPKISWPKFNFSQWRPGQIALPAFWPKGLMTFMVACLIIITPFSAISYYQNLEGKKADILQKTSQALLHLATSQKAASAQDMYNAEYELRQSAANFDQAKANLDEINLAVKGLIKILPSINKQFTTADKLIGAGEKLSASAAALTKAIEKIKINRSIDSLNLTANLAVLADCLNLILPDLQNANDDLQKIYLDELPAKYHGKIKTLQAALPVLTQNMENFISVSELLNTLLGQDSQKRYLVLFQNNNEIRPTGGFIGSFALVDIDRGNVKKIDIPGGGPYDLRAGLKASIESPLPLHIMNPRWEFQDGNWFADLPASAEKLLYLYEKSGGPTVDGIIFINASQIEKLLALTGPIDLPKYNLAVTKDNFINEIQKNVESEYDQAQNKPKQIIADLAPLLINKVLQTKPEQLFDLLNLFLTSLNEKEIQFYFTDYNLEKFVTNNNWGGKMKNTDKDFLSIVSTNIAGEKTDAKIKQTAILKIQVQPDGSIINNLSITKEHLGLLDEPYYGVPNLDYLRVYVPKDSQLIKAEGFEIMDPEFFITADAKNFKKDPDLAQIMANTQIEPQSQTEIFAEGDKTVFANWMKVEPGETKTVTIQYKLPFKLNLQKSGADYQNLWQLAAKELGLAEQDQNSQLYSLYWQKQSGKNNFYFNAEIDFPTALNYEYIYPNSFQKSLQRFSQTSILDTDKIMAIIFQP